MAVIGFEQLECWQKAKDLAVAVYVLSKDVFLQADVGIRDQMRRASVSVASNIAEGKERETAPEFIRYLYMAKGSAGELKTQLIIMEEIGYLERKQSKDIKQKAQQVSGMIGALIRTLKSKR